MNRDIIELQKGVKATAVLIEDNDLLQINNSIVLTPTSTDLKLFQSKTIKNMIENKLILKSKEDICYLAIRNISSLSSALQGEIEGLIKDRVLSGIELPSNCVIILTIKDKSEINGISQGLYRFLVEA